MENILGDFHDESLAIKELNIIKEALGELEKTEDNFGLIHYDFDLDNLFLSEKNNIISVIDFDDSVYHWYVMDIVQSIQCIAEEVEEKGIVWVREVFLKGYKSQCFVNDELLEKAHIFKQYDNLYGYVRSLRALSEPVENQPEWMINLRKHVENLMKRDSKEFGKLICT